ncbi:MAG: type IV pilus assembly protein PilM [Candidatus Pacebacteria bacterium]|nr:type IV pilus assembly protein PilM [Candidatus Paceibacterota bacterium]
MIECLTLKTESFGLDVSDLSLKLVKLGKKGRFLKLASWTEIDLSPGIIERGEIKDEDALVKIIKDNLPKVKGEKLKTKNVVISLPEKEAFLQVIKMPKMEEKELKSAVLFEAENYVPFPIEEVYLDFEAVPSSKGHLGKECEVLIAAVPKKIVDSYVSSFKRAGLNIQAFEVESQSISRALIKNNITSSPVVLFDFGKSRASFIIFSGYSLRFTSTISISSQSLTEELSKYFKIDFEEAEKLKLKYGLEGFFDKGIKESKKSIRSKKIDKPQIAKAMLPVLNELAQQIKKYIIYYQSHNFGSGSRLNKLEKVEKIILSGRGSNLKRFTDFLSLELKIPVELGNPWINILPIPLKEVPQLPFKESLGYTSALGLAIRGIKGEENINIL